MAGRKLRCGTPAWPSIMISPVYPLFILIYWGVPTPVVPIGIVSSRAGHDTVDCRMIRLPVPRLEYRLKCKSRRGLCQISVSPRRIIPADLTSATLPTSGAILTIRGFVVTSKRRSPVAPRQPVCRGGDGAGTTLIELLVGLSLLSLMAVLLLGGMHLGLSVWESGSARQNFEQQLERTDSFLRQLLGESSLAIGPASTARPALPRPITPGDFWAGPRSSTSWRLCPISWQRRPLRLRAVGPCRGRAWISCSSGPA